MEELHLPAAHLLPTNLLVTFILSPPLSLPPELQMLKAFFPLIRTVLNLLQLETVRAKRFPLCLVLHRQYALVSPFSICADPLFQPHKFATYGIVPSTAPSSDDESEDTLPRASLNAPIEALQGLFIRIP